MQLGANAFAARAPAHAATGCGFFQRSAPVGGAANGIPLNVPTPFTTAPCTSPPVTLAVDTCPAAEKLRVKKAAATNAPYARCFIAAIPCSRLIRARDRDALLRHELAQELLGLGLRPRRLAVVRGDALRPRDDAAAFRVFDVEPRAMIDEILHDEVVALEHGADQRRDAFLRRGVHVHAELLDEQVERGRDLLLVANVALAERPTRAREQQQRRLAFFR